ncbi:MAG: hypothetical protein H7Y18_19380 [Clostridiaceae bacterium]|nr:hypothetical protein [Clostridiaceae bacterium]
MNIYSVINIDIVNSRKIANRDVFQNQFKSYLANLSYEYASFLVAPITLTLGDEWQIVIKDIRESYNIYLKIRQYLKSFNINCYCGIGIGTMSTREAVDTREMDGQVFIFARESLSIAKANKNSYSKIISTKDCKVYLQGISSKFKRNTSLDLDHIINNIIQNNETSMHRITEKQQQTIDLYVRLGTYSAILNEVPTLSKGMVSDRLRTSNFWLIESNKELIYNLLESYVHCFMEEQDGI